MSIPDLFHVIKDPVHGVMQFSDHENRWIKPFINHPLFQRLRHIRQVGLADLIFPGAVYTRFNHSLGCCYVGSQIANKIGLSMEDKQLVVLACLLHDIGHGPFSHAFENVFSDKFIRHEEWTPYALQQFSQPEFLAAFNHSNPDYPLSYEKLIAIEQMIMHRYTDNRLLADIVSSQLDADRLDYLLRDSHFCGVKYGEFDLRWMLHCLAPVSTDQGWRLGVTKKGMSVVEHYLVARWLMIRNIYHHDKKIAAEYLLATFLTELAKHILEADFLLPYRETTLGQLLIRIHAFNRSFQSKKIERTDIEAFLAENFELYKQLCDFHILVLMAELAQLTLKHDVVELAKRIHDRHMPKTLSLHPEQTDSVQKMIIDMMERSVYDISPWQLQVIRTPRLCYAGERDPIWVQESSGKARKIQEHSMLVQSLSNQYEQACLLLVDQAIINRPEVKKLIDFI
ncbi:MAG: HD domain-containing protein [Gammaproteobacteria bacterium]|nr:HD domain-containing protein [Gammaproteobacteria bacterium]